MKLGRKPRRYDPRVPHLSALLAGQKLPPVPPPVDYTQGMTGFGMMLNNELGDCTCAGCGHCDQLWTFHANPPELTPPDSAVLALYEAVGGYVPGNASTDNGCVEQEVLRYWMQTGFNGQKLSAFFEVDVRNTDDIKRTIDWCGACYIGFDVPSYIMGLTAPGSVWDLPGRSGIPGNADTSIEGGHCVVLAGFDDEGVTVISWGATYKMTWAFLAQYADEAYGLVNQYWVEKTGKTPANMTLPELQQQMQAICQPLVGMPLRSQLSWQVSAGISQPLPTGQPTLEAGVSVSF